MQFEEKLIKLRKENGLSQEDLGEKLNVTRQTISKWELGQTKPNAEKIMEIAKLFNVSTDELLNESEETVNTKEPIKEHDTNTRNTIIVIVLIAILIAVIVWLASNALGLGILNKILGIFNKEDNNIANYTTDVYNKATNVIDKAYEHIEDAQKEQNEINEKERQRKEEFDNMYNKATEFINDNLNKTLPNDN